MSRVVQDNFWSRNRWLLPLLLALLILIIIGVVVLGSRSSSSSSTPTATPSNVVVVTPTSSAQYVTATPRPGGSTPVPGATPQPTVQGLTLGMITHPSIDVKTKQAAAASGNPSYQFYLNPVITVQRTLPQYGFTGVYQIISPTSPTPVPTAYPDNLGRPTVKVVVRYRNKLFDVFAAQVGRRGPKGIWLIITIRQHTA